MPDLLSDIIGQVERLPLPPTKANTLIPLFEAVSNSLHAIQERYENDEEVVNSGIIKIEVIRQETKENSKPVIGFRITDNGVGLDDKNFKSFLTPFSRLKILRGGKGVGRLGWLKVFKNIKVESLYLKEEKFHPRDFNFILKEKDQIKPFSKKRDLSNLSTGTKVQLKNFKSSYKRLCPTKTNELAQNLISHFLPVFAADRAPKIILEDNEEINLKSLFDKMEAVSDLELIKVNVDDECYNVYIRHIRCDKKFKPKEGGYNWLCFCANDRGVKEYPIDNQIGLKLLCDNKIYVGTITSDYLDKHVNPERTDFVFDQEVGLYIRRKVAECVRRFLKEDIDAILAEKTAISRDVINKNPQYLYLIPEIDEFVSNLKPSSKNEEQIHQEMALNRYRRQRKFKNINNAINSTIKYDETLAEKISEYESYLIDVKKGALAEYVLRRKAVLDLLDKLRGFECPIESKYPLEEAIHSIICPMRSDSHCLGIEDHNLWILDDRLAFFNFFASDKTIRSYTDVESNKEPDLAFFYKSCFAWRETDHSCDTVILVEFKRPGKNDYNDKTDPFMQIMDYINLFKSGKSIQDHQGRILSGIGENTAFHCYIVADLTNNLRRRLAGKLQKTPDSRGLFGYTTDPNAFVEVIPYDKLLIDANIRNSIFFEKLGLTDS